MTEAPSQDLGQLIEAGVGQAWMPPHSDQMHVIEGSRHPEDDAFWKLRFRSATPKRMKISLAV